MGDATFLPVPLRAWAATRTEVGGRGGHVQLFDLVLGLTPPPNLGPLRGPSPQGEGESCFLLRL